MPKDLGIQSLLSNSSSSSSDDGKKQGSNINQNEDPSSPQRNKFNGNKSFLSVDTKKSVEDFESSNADSYNKRGTKVVQNDGDNLFKQSTLINDISLMKDVMAARPSYVKPLNLPEDKPAKERWKLCIFELGKKQYHSFENKKSADYNIPLVPEDETLIICVNFSQKELKSLLIDKLDVNPIMHYECILLSPVDKVMEFNDRAIFYNIVINRDEISEDPAIIRVIRKMNFAVMVVKELENDSFKLPESIAKKFGFKKIENNYLPNQSFVKGCNSSRHDDQDSSESFDLEANVKVDKGEVGQVIIQKMKTIIPNKADKISIDYILFWMSNEGLKKIEKLINENLLREVNEIQEEVRDLGMNSKHEFLQKLDLFQNHYIGAQNAKESKQNYFDQIISSELPSIEFRFLIRHLKSRMSNLHNTTVIIERKLELSRGRFQANIDANLTDYSRQLDGLMKKFSVTAVIFIPLQLISGIWGMNCKVPFQEIDSEWPFIML